MLVGHSGHNPVMGHSLFSLRNELVSAGDRASYLELNPAVLSDEDCDRFALSAVYIGPRREGEEGPLSMRIVCSGTSTTLRAVGEKSEPIDARQNLTVALFSVSRAFLEMLARAGEVEVELGPDSHPLTRRMAPVNRANVGHFLDNLDARQVVAEPAVPAGAVA